jgi:serine protease Do
VDGRPMDNVAALIGVSFEHVSGAPMKVQALRGDRTLWFNITPVEVEEPSDRLADLGDIVRSQIPSMGIMALTLDERSASAVGPVRLATGAVVMARTADSRATDIGLQPGDVIHELNRTNVVCVEDLKSALAELKSGDPVAVHVERGGMWFYVTFDMP